jgi:hypothetical protein
VNLIPWDASSVMTLWYNAWRRHIQCVKGNPGQTKGYQRAAMIAHMQYLCYGAQAMHKFKNGEK